MRFRICVALAVIVASAAACSNSADTGPLPIFSSVGGINGADCQRVDDNHYTCRSSAGVIRVERSKTRESEWLESSTHADLRDYLVTLIYGPPADYDPG